MARMHLQFRALWQAYSVAIWGTILAFGLAIALGVFVALLAKHHRHEQFINAIDIVLRECRHRFDIYDSAFQSGEGFKRLKQNIFSDEPRFRSLKDAEYLGDRSDPAWHGEIQRRLYMDAHRNLQFLPQGEELVLYWPKFQEEHPEVLDGYGYITVRMKDLLSEVLPKSTPLHYEVRDIDRQIVLFEGGAPIINGVKERRAFHYGHLHWDILFTARLRDFPLSPLEQPAAAFGVSGVVGFVFSLLFFAVIRSRNQNRRTAQKLQSSLLASQQALARVAEVAASGGVEQLHPLLQELMAYTALDADDPRFEKVDCGPAFQRVLQKLRDAIFEANASIQVDYLPIVLGEEREIEWLFELLLKNALLHRSDAPLDIRVHTKTVEDHWQFCFSDNGSSLPSEELSGLFTLFDKHGDVSDKRSGVGLATGKKIVERHHGWMWAESDEHQGLKFYFTLPQIQREVIED